MVAIVLGESRWLVSAETAVGEGATVAELETRESVLEPELCGWIQTNRSTAFCTSGAVFDPIIIN